MSVSPDIALPQFPVADVLRALPRPITMDAFTNWCRRDPPAILLMDDDRAGFINGRARLLSFRRATQIALTAELVGGFGLVPRRAGLIASRFTDMATGKEKRRPGMLFEKGETFLAAYPDKPVAVLLNLSHESRLFDVLRAEGGARWTSAIVLHVNPVVEYLRQELGLPGLETEL